MMYKELSQSSKSRRLLSFIATASLIFLATLATSCSKSSGPPGPMAVYKNLMQARVKGDWETYKRGLTRATLEQQQQLAQEAGLSLEEYFKSLGKTNLLLPEMRNEKIDGDNATIEIKIEGPISGWYTIPFIKEDGEWKFATAERMKDVKFSKD